MRYAAHAVSSSDGRFCIVKHSLAALLSGQIIGKCATMITTREETVVPGESLCHESDPTAINPVENNLATSHNPIETIPSRVRIELCEFERVLQCTMEILSARARTATASGS
jgi:hypothetical protein